MMTIFATLTAAIALAATGSASLAVPVRSSTAANYRVVHRGDGDVYCIRFFADAQAADPRPGRPGTVCHSRTRWAKEGIGIHDPMRDAATAAGAGQ